MLRALFVTYALGRIPFVGPAMLGALKRCLRLIKCAPAGALDAHWVHRGPLFDYDPMIREMLARVPRYDLDGSPLPLGARGAAAARNGSAAWHLPALGVYYGQAQARMGRGLRALARRLSVDVVVLADNPLSGILREGSRTAHELGIPQVGVDDYLSPGQPEALFASTPMVDEWFLVGLPPPDSSPRVSERVVVAPPLLPPASPGEARTGEVLILGYDPRVAQRGLQFVAELPPGTPARLYSGPLTALQRRRYQQLADGATLTCSTMPDEPHYRRALASAALVFCKNGFQQMVEALAMGAPVVAHEVVGGADSYFVDQALHSWIKFLGAQGKGWTEALSAARTWLAGQPTLPWAAHAAAPDLASHGARLFVDCLNHAVKKSSRPTRQPGATLPASPGARRDPR